LLARSGWWYLVGHDQSVNAERTFRVDRIEGEVSIRRDIACKRPSGFDIRKAFPVDLKELPGAIDVGGEVAQVLVNASDVGVVLGQYTQSAVVENRPDGSAVFQVPCSNVQAFEQWLFGFLDRAEVLAPPALRQHVVDWLLEMTGSVTRGER
jgi:proteasome accessory factor B